MPSLRLSTVLITLVGLSLALKCYEGQTKKNNKPKAVINCTGKYCFKLKVYNDKNYWYNNHTCGNAECK
ncbi:hypothetical protein OESDEN_20058, partial [Oesophagostomum dentatum]